jgi:hypothetical protein
MSDRLSPPYWSPRRSSRRSSPACSSRHAKVAYGGSGGGKSWGFAREVREGDTVTDAVKLFANAMRARP